MIVEEWANNLWYNRNTEYYKYIKIIFSWNIKSHGESLKKEINIKILPKIMSGLYAYR